MFIRFCIVNRSNEGQEYLLPMHILGVSGKMLDIRLS
jgi:hypothetical protein